MAWTDWRAQLIALLCCQNAKIHPKDDSNHEDQIINIPHSIDARRASAETEEKVSNVAPPAEQELNSGDNQSSAFCDSFFKNKIILNYLYFLDAIDSSVQGTSRNKKEENYSQTLRYALSGITQFKEIIAKGKKLNKELEVGNFFSNN